MGPLKFMSHHSALAYRDSLDPVGRAQLSRTVWVSQALVVVGGDLVTKSSLILL